MLCIMLSKSNTTGITMSKMKKYTLRKGKELFNSPEKFLG